MILVIVLHIYLPDLSAELLDDDYNAVQADNTHRLMTAMIDKVDELKC